MTIEGWQNKNYYDLLGVPKTASRAQIKQAYRDIALVYHPDSNFFTEIIESSHQGGDQDLFKRITAAYHTLMNQGSREAYDQSLPPDLPGWNRKTSDPIAEKMCAYAANSDGRLRPKSSAFGVFGKVPNTPESAFGHIFSADVKPMSELLKAPRRRGVWGRFCALIGF